MALYLVDFAKEIMESDPKKALENYEKSAALFDQEGYALQAAKSYFSLRNYERAKVLFIKAEYFAEAGECVMKIIIQIQNQEKEKEKIEKEKGKEKEKKEKIEKKEEIKEQEKIEKEKKYKELYKEAMVYFDNANNYAKAIECCEMIKDFKAMVKLMKKYESFIANFTFMFESNLKKYISELETNMINLCNEFF